MLFKDPDALQVCILLEFIEPEIWRRLIVPRNSHLGEPHPAIQAAFKWWDSRLHEFRIGGLCYGDPEQDDGGFEDSARWFSKRDECQFDFRRDIPSAFTYF